MVGPGQELASRYRLEHLVGRGGMGEVWRAWDLRLDRRVAVKVLRLAWAGDQRDRALARFRREARAAAQLNHPRIATIHDAADHQGLPFLVMELLAGPDLGALLETQARGLSVDTVLEYGAQAAEGLAAAHAAGVVHRDIKPSNLMLDADRALRICDFGIAQLEGATAGLTSVGQAIGTFAYTPPEQLLGNPVTGAADVYALGATLFHLLTGRQLFSAEDLRALMGQHLHKDPPLASSLRPDISEDLATYLATLVAKAADARPATHTIPARLRTLATSHLLAEADILSGPLADSIVRAQWSREFGEGGELGALATSLPNRPYLQAVRLAEIATVMSVRDPARAEELLAVALRRVYAPQIVFPMFKDLCYLVERQVESLAKIANRVSSWDPAKATEILSEADQRARSGPEMGGWSTVVALVLAAAETAAWDPARAGQLLADATSLASSWHGEAKEATVRAAEMVAYRSLAAAQWLADTIADPQHHELVSAAVAEIAEQQRRWPGP